MINKIFLDDIILNFKPEKLHCEKIKKQKIIIECNDCKKLVELKNLRKEFFEKEYLCKSCCRKGERSGMFGKHHSEEAKKKIGGSVVDYNGKNNPFYGKHHSDKTKEKLSKILMGKLIGNKNPFYGKEHSKEIKLKIIEGNKKYRENNKEKIIKESLIKMNKTIGDFKNILNEYINTPANLSSLQEKYNLDKRTIMSYWLKLNIINKEKLKTITMEKKLNSNPSKPEYDLFVLLKNKYGENNVIHHFNFEDFCYDICLFNKFLIEYDGYYWHEKIKNKYDEIKNRIAIENNFVILRVKEKNNRINNPNLQETINKISEFIEQFGNQPVANPVIFYLQNN